MAAKPEIENLRGEKWVVLAEKNALGQNYAISNHGRLVCFTKHLHSGHILKVSRQQGYPIWRWRKKNQYHAILIHRLVAQYFLPKPKARQKFILHKNHDKEDNYFRNLQWATQEDITAHSQKNPLVINHRQKMLEFPQYPNTKLTAAKVKTIRGLLTKGKTLKEIAQRYGVSDMQIHRIKTGENWKNVQ